MSIPKNYISSGISKTFLTPCRRVGLSRSKKTPKIASPLTPVPNIENNACNKNIGGSTDKKNINFEETPKRLKTSKQENDSINKDDIVLDNSKDNNSSVGHKVLKTKLVSDITSNKVNEAHHTAKNDKKRIIKESPITNIALKSHVTVELLHPVAKRSINFNIFDKSPTRCPTKEEIAIKKSKIGAFAEKNIPCSDQVEENSLKNLKENSFKDAVIKNKKRRLRLDSDDFASDENLLKSINSPKTRISPKASIIKNCKTFNKCSNSITLGRFTTEDYLKEYSSDPEKFQENLEGDSSVTTTIKNDNDIKIEAFSNFQQYVKTDSMKSEDASDPSKKDYVAIVCSSIHQSNEIKTKRSLSTKKSSLESTKPLEKVFTSDSKLKHNLTVSLERLTKENLKTKLKSEDNKKIQSKDLHLELITSSPAPTKINIFEVDDDEVFTSSPENDKKQCDNLVQLILNMEKEIKQKQDKLETLTQAQVYKNKHSPEKLKVSSDRWLEGCRASLEDLLLKMQEHGPMEMDTLTKKLRIPNDILEKLNV